MHEGCEVRKGLERDLGFEKIFGTGRDIEMTERKNDAEGKIFVCTETDANLIGVIRDAPRAIIFNDMKVNKKAIEQMGEYEVTLCVPIGSITSLYGLQRSRALYLTRKLVKHARKMKIGISIVTLAKDRTGLCSYIQLLEMAKLLGLDEQHAKESIGNTTRSLVEG